MSFGSFCLYVTVQYVQQYSSTDPSCVRFTFTSLHFSSQPRSSILSLVSFPPPLHLKYLACSLHVLKMGSVIYLTQLFILSSLRPFHRLQISDRSILQSLTSFQPLVESKGRETKQSQPYDNCPKARNAVLLKDKHFALLFSYH